MRPKFRQYKGVIQFVRGRSVGLIVSLAVISAFLFCASTGVAEFSASCFIPGDGCSSTGEEKDGAHEHHDHGDAKESDDGHTHGSQPTSPNAPKESASELCCSSLVAVRTNVSSGYQPSHHPDIIQLGQTTPYARFLTRQLASSRRAHAPPENFSESDRLHKLFRSVCLNHAPPSFVVSR